MNKYPKINRNYYSKRHNFKFFNISKLRIIIGILGAVVSVIISILSFIHIIHIGSANTISLYALISFIFFIIFIFSPLLACFVSALILIGTLPSSVFKIAVFIGATIGILLLDNSGLREIVFKNIKFDRLIRFNNKYDQRLELYKTLSWFFTLIYWAIPAIHIISAGLLLLFPILAIFRYLINSKKISYCSGDFEDFSTMFSLLFFPSIFMLIWYSDNQTNTKLIWIESGALASIWIILFLIFTREYLKKWTIALSFIFSILLFSFGSVCHINRNYDFYNPVEYKVSIVYKDFNGRPPSFYLYTSFSENNKTSMQIEVDWDIYDHAKIGNNAYVFKHHGALGIEWFSLKLNENM